MHKKKHPRIKQRSKALRNHGLVYNYGIVLNLEDYGLKDRSLMSLWV